MKTVVKTFQNEGDQKKVGFKITDNAGNLFVIDKLVAIADGKTDEQYVAEALTASQAEIDEWQASFSVIGREWDADAGAFVAEKPAAEESTEVSE
jgi:hypothetical protein